MANGMVDKDIFNKSFPLHLDSPNVESTYNGRSRFFIFVYLYVV